MFNTRLYKTDLNQLLLLRLILEHKNLTKVAHCLEISQPAVSRNLGALRQHFDDELIVRDKQSYMLTPFAMRLLPKLERFIDSVEALAREEPFSPSNYQGCFTLALLSTVSSEVTHKLIKRVRKEAPNVSFKIQEWGEDSLDALQDLTVDLGLGHANDTYSALRQRQVGLYFPSFAVFNEHPLASRASVGLGELFSYPHVKYVVPGFKRTIEGAKLFAKYRFERHTVLETSDPNAAVGTFVGARDLVINQAQYLPSLYQYRDQLTFLRFASHTETPARGMALQLLWHNRNHNEAAHRWLRELVYEELQGVIDMPHPEHVVDLNMDPDTTTY